MKTVQSLMSIGLGFALAWGILTFFPQRKVSTFKLDPWPVDMDNSNLALIGVGLESRKPKPSVMDPTPGAKPTMVILSPASPVKSQVASAPAQPAVMMPAQSPKPPMMMAAQSPMPPMMMAAQSPMPPPMMMAAQSPKPVMMTAQSPMPPPMMPPPPLQAN